jgi:hypothetical protein
MSCHDLKSLTHVPPSLSLATPPPPPPQARPRFDRLSQGRYCFAQLHSEVDKHVLDLSSNSSFHELAFLWLSSGLIWAALFALDRYQLVPKEWIPDAFWMTVAFLAMAYIYGGAALQGDLTLLVRLDLILILFCPQR